MSTLLLFRNHTDRADRHAVNTKGGVRKHGVKNKLSMQIWEVI